MFSLYISWLASHNIFFLHFRANFIFHVLSSSNIWVSISFWCLQSSSCSAFALFLPFVLLPAGPQHATGLVLFKWRWRAGLGLPGPKTSGQVSYFLPAFLLFSHFSSLHTNKLFLYNFSKLIELVIGCHEQVCRSVIQVLYPGQDVDLCWHALATLVYSLATFGWRNPLEWHGCICLDHVNVCKLVANVEISVC